MNSGRSIHRKSTGLLSRRNASRDVVLRGRITKDAASCCVARLIVLGCDYPDDPIFLYIDSPGGGFRDSLMILSTMKGLRSPVHTFCSGSVTGMALVLASQGARGHRAVASSARFSFKGMTVDRSWRPEHLQYVAAILAEHTGQALAVISRWITDEQEFSAAEAKAAGLVDVISG